MTEKDSCSDNKYLFAFITVLMILIALVFLITAISAQTSAAPEYYDPSGASLLADDGRNALGGVSAENTSDTEVSDYNESDQVALKTDSIVFPLDGKITSLFAWRVDPFYDSASGEEPTYEFHRGIDISASKSRDVKACAIGTVTFTGYDTGYGNYIMIEHENYVSLYAHCSSIICSVGDIVEAGESIAVAGSTGRSTGPHLHFEIQVDGMIVDPLDYVGCVYTGTMY